MTDRQITFRAEMVRALLSGRKSMTRRLLKPQPPTGLMPECYAIPGEAQPVGSGWSRGDRLWVREVFAYGWPVEGNHQLPECNQEHAITYRADGNRPFGSRRRWHSPIHMPRWASRLTLTVTDVRVQRLQDISEADAQAEGLVEVYEGWATDRDGRHWGPTARASYRVLWNDLHGEDAWDRNPWVTALTFTVHRQNIDQMEPTND